MAKIIDTGISLSATTPTSVFILFGADIRFSPQEISAGQSGSARFRLECIVWDDDQFFNDRIASKSKPIPASSIREITGVEMEFQLGLDHLRSKEGPFEKTIELFGEFILKRDGKKIAPAVKGRNLNVRISGGTPVGPGSGPRQRSPPDFGACAPARWPTPPCRGGAWLSYNAMFCQCSGSTRF